MVDGRLFVWYRFCNQEGELYVFHGHVRSWLFVEYVSRRPRGTFRLICRIGSRKEVDLNSTYDRLLDDPLYLRSRCENMQTIYLRITEWSGIVNKVDVSENKGSWQFFFFFDKFSIDIFSLQGKRVEYMWLILFIQFIYTPTHPLGEINVQIIISLLRINKKERIDRTKRILIIFHDTILLYVLWHTSGITSSHDTVLI